MAPLDRDVSGRVFSICVRSIESAAVKPGKPLGPCLLSPGSDEPWTVGRWNGDGWFNKDGELLQPELWALLPQL